MKVKLHRNQLLAAISLIIFASWTFITSLQHEFGNLLVYAAVLLFKYVFIFLVPITVDFKKNKYAITQSIFAGTIFQSVLIIYENLKNGNVGSFIESTLPGISYGTPTSELSGLLRANGTFNEPNIAAIYLLINFCIIVPFLFNKNKAYNSRGLYLKLVLIILIAVAVVFTGSRSIWFLFLILTLFFTYKYKRTFLHNLYKALSNIWFKIVLGAIIVFITPYLFARIDTLKDVLNSNGALRYRNELNTRSLTLSDLSISGVGVNMTPYYLAKNFKTVDSEVVNFDPAPPHNIFIQIISEEGFMGLIIFICFIYFCLRKFIVQHRPLNSFALSFFAYLVAAMFHPAFTTHPEILSFFILYGSIANLEDNG